MTTTVDVAAIFVVVVEAIEVRVAASSATAELLTDYLNEKYWPSHSVVTCVAAVMDSKAVSNLENDWIDCGRHFVLMLRLVDDYTTWQDL